MTLRNLFVRAAAGWLVSLTVSAAPQLPNAGHAVSENGQLFTVNASLGTGQVLGNLGLSGLHSLARDANGELWTATGGSATQSTQFHLIDPATAQTTQTFSFGLGGTVNGMAFDAKNRMFVVVDPSASPNDRVFRIDVSTGIATLLGSTGVTTLRSLAIAPWGSAYTWHDGGSAAGKGLMKLDLASGVATDVNAAVGGGAEIQALAFRADGSLVGGRDRLFRIDTASGATTAFGVIASHDWRGMTVTQAMTELNAGMAIESDGDVWRVNSENGARSLVGNCGRTSVVALTRRALARQFIAAVDLGAATELVEIDFEDAGATPLGSIALDDVRAMTETSPGVLYLLQDGGAGNDRVHAVSLPSLITALVNFVGSPRLEALAFGPFGDLFAWDTALGLVIAPLGGSAVDDLDSSTGASAAISSLAFDASWRLVGVGSALYRVGFDGGTMTQLGADGLNDVVGFEFVTPAPASPAVFYCSTQVNSAGCAPFLDASGPFPPSLSTTSGFTLAAHNLLPNKVGLIFYGTSIFFSPWQGGTLCVRPPLRRTPLSNSGGNAAPCSGVLQFDFNAHLASGADPTLVAGTRVFAQFWSRDPAATSTKNLTNAAQFTILP